MTAQLDTTATTAAVLEERISAIAYGIWEAEGCPQGRAEDHWQRACGLAAEEAPTAGPEPGWLKREPAIIEKPALKPDISQTLDQMAKRIAGRSAA